MSDVNRAARELERILGSGFCCDGQIGGCEPSTIVVKVTQGSDASKVPTNYGGYEVQVSN